MPKCFNGRMRPETGQLAKRLRKTKLFAGYCLYRQQKNSCSVSGHNFTRAVHAEKMMGFSPCCFLPLHPPPRLVSTSNSVLVEAKAEAMERPSFEGYGPLTVLKE
jgi:hypothetical protein